jgi:hypothetical protein
MCDVLFIVDVVLIPFSTLSGSEKITKLSSESIFSMISSVSPVATAFAVKVDAILANLNFQLIPSLTHIAAKLIFEPSVAKHLLVLIFFVKYFFGIPRCDPLLPLFIFPHRKIPWPRRRSFHICS